MKQLDFALVCLIAVGGAWEIGHPIDLIEGALIGIACVVAALTIVLGAVW